MGHTVEAQFLSDWQMDLVHIGSDPQAMLEKLVQSAGLSPDSQLDKI
jgi:hypothetical protein